MCPFRGGQRRRKQTQGNYGNQHVHRWNPFAWGLLALVVVAVLAFVAFITFRTYPPTGTMPYYGYPFYGWFFWPFGFIFFFFIFFFVVRLIFWPWGGGWRRRYWYGYNYGDAHEIVRQRYARGEITKEQFDQMNRDLEQR